jgi:hypothetical protein
VARKSAVLTAVLDDREKPNGCSSGTARFTRKQKRDGSRNRCFGPMGSDT